MRPIILIFFVLHSLGSIGQRKYTLDFTTENFKQVKKNIQTSFKDSLSALTYLRDLRDLAVMKGYLTASVDNIMYSDSSWIVDLFIGEKFGQANISIRKEDLVFLRKNAGLKEKAITNIPFRPTEISHLIETIQNTALSEGYPFVSVSLKNCLVVGNVLSADLVLTKGERYTFSDVHIKGDSSVSEVFLTSLIGIKPGDTYNETALKGISQKIEQISFLKEIKPHELLFTEKGVELFLYLKSNPVSTVNGAIGLQPNVETGRMGVVGELNLKLLNTLKHGELINLNWRSIRPQTQSLLARLNYPFIFKTPFGIDGQFQLYKRDTTFLELRSTIGIQYFMRGGNYLKAFYQNFSSSILSGSTNNSEFSNLSSVRTNADGLSLFRRQVEDIPNPSQGWGLASEISIGSRRSQENDSTAWIRSSTYRASILLEYYLPMTKRHVMRFSGAGEFYYAPEIYQNELFRFGGLNSLRGFNEEELFASTRVVGTLEYRFLLDRNSNVFVFYDQAFYENNAAIYSKDNPLGFGAGLSFGTNLGIFSISYALGKQQGNPILMRNGKIHFGYIAYF
ncbi:MAG: POTRA domain-containing protein [Flavobacteriia bacterium]